MVYPSGTHNARPFLMESYSTILQNDFVRYVTREGTKRAFEVISFEVDQLDGTGLEFLILRGNALQRALRNK